MTLNLEKFKSLLGITDAAQDTALQFILDDVTETICNYCHLPEMLEGLKILLTVWLWTFAAPKALARAPPAGNVTSIKEGDTTVAFKQCSPAKAFIQHLC